MNKSIQNDFVNQRTRLSSLIMQILLWLIRAYQYVLSPWLGPSCRYLPSCSEYAREALDNHGLWQGGWLALRRISRCHPLGASGYDPVPTTSAGTGRQCRNGHGDWHGN